MKDELEKLILEVKEGKRHLRNEITDLLRKAEVKEAEIRMLDSFQDKINELKGKCE